MEVGAVKQAFNNEIILLKKNLNQAKIQIIHKLTRKAKTFKEKKAPEKFKEKLKRKAESAVSEVLIIKKIKPRNLAKFIVTHTDELNKYLNKPKVDEEKACARLLLHKALQGKYNYIRSRFSNIPIKDLFMSRQERKKLKKEAKEKSKKRGKANVPENPDIQVSNIDSDNEENTGCSANEEKDDNELSADDIDSDGESEILNNENQESPGNEDLSMNYSDENYEQDEESNSQSDNSETESTGRFVKICTIEKNAPLLKSKTLVDETTNADKKYIKEIDKTVKNKKNRNLRDKLISRNFKKTSEEVIQEKKIVDPFFITSTSEKYMSLVEPRPPDEFKEIHKTGNRKQRRAIEFGRTFETNRRDNRRNNAFKSNNHNRLNKECDRTYRRNDFTANDRNSFKAKNDMFAKNKEISSNNNNNTEKQEKLHPSWEAKKKQSSILPFQGKKIVFNED